MGSSAADWDILDDLAVLPDELLDHIKAMIKTAANNERKKIQNK
jgi:hypothetical protein